LGRAAYHNPGLLAEVDARFNDDPASATDWPSVIDAMTAYAARHIESGGRLVHVTRHMTGLFHGLPGARRWRQVLSTDATRPGAGPDILRRAFAEIRFGEPAAAA